MLYPAATESRAIIGPAKRSIAVDAGVSLLRQIGLLDDPAAQAHITVVQHR